MSRSTPPTSAFVKANDAVALVENILEASTEYSVVATDLDGTILLWNAGAQARYGYTAAEAVGQRTQILHTAQDVAAGEPQEMMAAALRLGKWEGTVTRVRKDGTTFSARVVLTTRRDREGDPVGFLLISKDITDEQAILKQLKDSHAALKHATLESEERSRRDPLTGLLNHREFHDGVRREAERDGSNFSVAMFDVDGFKAINDDYGHAEGDRVLCRLGGDADAVHSRRRSGLPRRRRRVRDCLARR
jgi:PAS domain S-box-containing protein